MKKYLCKTIPGETEGYDIEIKSGNTASHVLKLVLIGAFAAFCMGMAVAVFVWAAHVNSFMAYFLDPDYFKILVGAIIVLTITPMICGSVVIFKLIEASVAENAKLTTKVCDAAKKHAEEKANK